MSRQELAEAVNEAPGGAVSAALAREVAPSGMKGRVPCVITLLVAQGT